MVQSSRENYLAAVGNRTRHPPYRSNVAVPTALPQLQNTAPVEMGWIIYKIWLRLTRKSFGRQDLKNFAASVTVASGSTQVGNTCFMFPLIQPCVDTE